MATDWKQFWLDVKDDLIKAKTGADLFFPTPYTRIPLFRDYLTSMETFIEQEIDKRNQDLQAIMTSNQIYLDEEPPVEWILASNDLESAEDFSQMLRNSFFVNLYAYVESFLVDRYESNIPQQQNVIKFVAKELIGEFLNYLPEWQHIPHHIKIRNCIVHQDGFLDDCNHAQAISDYAKSHSKLSIVEVHPVYRSANTPDIAFKKLILNKGFCEDALMYIQGFLLSLEFLSEKLGKRFEPKKSIDLR